MHSPTSWRSSRHRAAVLRVVTLCALVLVFDGYDLVVYGTVVPVLPDDPSQLGALSAAQAGALGSYALVGMGHRRRAQPPSRSATPEHFGT